MKKKLKAVFGITNKTEDKMYIPFFDFDNKDIDGFPDVYFSMIHTIEQYKLPMCFFIGSTNGYNAFCLDKLSFDECITICDNTDYVDKNYIKYAKEKNNFTIRLGDDKKFLGMMSRGTEPNKHALSSAHYNFFNAYFHKDIMNNLSKSVFNFDNLENLELVLYMSKKYGYIKVD